MTLDPSDTACALVCFACSRAKDNFGHVHIKSKDAPEIAMCLPCLTGLANALGDRMRAYMGGGIMFDPYLRKEIRERLENRGTPLPRFIRDLMEELERNGPRVDLDGDDDDD